MLGTRNGEFNTNALLAGSSTANAMLQLNQNQLYIWITNSGTISISKYIGCDDSVTVPSTITGLPVTRIGDRAFALYNRGLSSVMIPNSVISIGSYAFAGSTNLTNITIPSGVASIGSYAFVFCTQLTNITVPSSVTSIGDGAFFSCHGLARVYFRGTPPAWVQVYSLIATSI